MNLTDIHKCLKYFEQNIHSLEFCRIVCESKMIKISTCQNFPFDYLGTTSVEIWMDGREFYMMKNSDNLCVALPFDNIYSDTYENLLSRENVLQRYNVSNTTLSNWRKTDPAFPKPVKVNDKKVFWKIEDLEKWEGCQAVT